ncbi:MAG: CDP-glycerol glycerophosphotransferase family protein [Candidatus Omnitrophota bacterium]|jgi:predicted glycosyltransferase
MKKRILFVTYGGGHVNLLIPLIKRFKAEGKYDLSILGLSVAHTVLKREGIPYKTYNDYFDPRLDRDIIPLGEKLADMWHIDGLGFSRRDSVKYFGFCMRDLIRSKGKERAWSLIKKNGRKAFLPVYIMERIIEQEKPDLLVTGICPRSERAAIEVCRKKKIPSIACNDYLATEKRHHIRADVITAMCEITKINLVKSGHDPKKVMVVGQPALDHILGNNRRLKKDAILKKLGIPKNRRIVVLATQPKNRSSFPVGERMLKKTAEALLSMSDSKRYHLVVKPHPCEGLQEYKDLLQSYEGKLNYTLTDTDVRHLIKISDVMITFFSTVGFESVLMGKPLIQLNLTRRKNPVPLFKYGVSVEARSAFELKALLEQIIERSELKRKFAKNRERYFHGVIDGNGTRRVAALMRGILNHGVRSIYIGNQEIK